MNPMGWPDIWVEMQQRIMYEYWSTLDVPVWSRPKWARCRFFEIGGKLGVAEGAD